MNNSSIQEVNETQKLLIEKNQELESEIVRINQEVTTLKRQTNQIIKLYHSKAKTQALIAVGIGVLACLTLFGLSIDSQIGNSKISYSGQNPLQLAIKIASIAGGIFAFIQYKKSQNLGQNNDQ